MTAGLRINIPEVRIAALVAKWAGLMNLPHGNLWEPALIRVLTAKFRELGGDANALAFVEAFYAISLGINP